MEDLTSENEQKITSEENTYEENLSDEYEDCQEIEQESKFGKLKMLLCNVKDNVGYDKKDKKFFIGKFRISRKLTIIILIISVIICAFAACSASAKKKMQQAMLQIKKKFGKNAILKGMNLLDGATAKERNEQIGGHKA